MKRLGLSRLARVCAFALPMLGALIVAEGQAHAQTLVFGDEFDANTGGGVSGSWHVYSGADVNGPDQYFDPTFQWQGTDANDSDGTTCLVLFSYPVANSGKNYSSSKISTEGGFHYTYGWSEARMKMPDPVGRWPGFWQVGTNCDYTVGNCQWPESGSDEIDIMEFQSNNPNKCTGANHWGSSVGADNYNIFTWDSGSSLAHNWHNYAVNWFSGDVQWYYDGNLVGESTSNIPSTNEFLILGYGFMDNGSGVPPAGVGGFLEVDWIHVYQ